MLPKEYASKKGFLFHTAGVPLFVFGMLLLFSPTSFDRFSITWPRYCNNFRLGQYFAQDRVIVVY